MRRASLLGLGVTALIAAGGGQAMAGYDCCWRVEAKASGSIHVDWGAEAVDDNAYGPEQNGTYDLSWDWTTRVLRSFNIDRGHMARIEDRNGRARTPQGKSRFHGSESSREWYMSDETRVDKEPCDFSAEVPWGRYNLHGAQYGGHVNFGHTGDADRLEMGPDGRAFQRWGDQTCDRFGPFYGATSTFEDVSGKDGEHVSEWTAFEAKIHPMHADPIFKPRKLKKEKDYAVTFNSSHALVQDSSGEPEGAATASVVIRFKWFPYDRVQKEINELEKLKGFD